MMILLLESTSILSGRLRQTIGLYRKAAPSCRDKEYGLAITIWKHGILISPRSGTQARIESALLIKFTSMRQVENRGGCAQSVDMNGGQQFVLGQWMNVDVQTAPAMEKEKLVRYVHRTVFNVHIRYDFE